MCKLLRYDHILLLLSISREPCGIQTSPGNLRKQEFGSVEETESLPSVKFGKLFGAWLWKKKAFGFVVVVLKNPN